MLVPIRSGQFRRGVKRAEKRGKDLIKLRELLELLLNNQQLPLATGTILCAETGPDIETRISSQTGC